jgi:signal peptidase I
MRFAVAVFSVVSLAVLLASVRRRFQFVVVTGGSMRPTFHHGDLLVGRRNVTTLSRGDAVVFRVYPSDYPNLRDPRSAWLSRRVKRVVATSGDRAPAALPPTLRQRHDGVVPPGYFAVAGDNPNSEGSAEFGYVAVDRVDSVVVRRLRRSVVSDPEIGT